MFLSRFGVLCPVPELMNGGRRDGKWEFAGPANNRGGTPLCKPKSALSYES
jgi:hypothetical protein